MQTTRSVMHATTTQKGRRGFGGSNGGTASPHACRLAKITLLSGWPLLSAPGGTKHVKNVFTTGSIKSPLSARNASTCRPAFPHMARSMQDLRRTSPSVNKSFSVWIHVEAPYPWRVSSTLKITLSSCGTPPLVECRCKIWLISNSLSKYFPVCISKRLMCLFAAAAVMLSGRCWTCSAMKTSCSKKLTWRMHFQSSLNLAGNPDCWRPTTSRVVE
mmetsp:Transcript_54546/g.152140  ORF Transcript_54546/g.152140 Transcript_54546/m.152140 type:complete len:216 (+) Transcript_54546:268-915(+)